MNVLFLMGRYPSYGGVETVTTVLANDFVRNGLNVFVISFEQTLPDLEIGLLPEIKLLSLSFPVLSISNIKKLRNLIRSDKIDFIVNQWCIPFYVTMLCKIAIHGSDCLLIAVHHNLPNKNSRIVDIEIKLGNPQKGKFKKVILYLELKLIIWISILSLRYVYTNSSKFIVLSKSFMEIFFAFTKIRNFSKIVSISNPLTIDNSDFDYSFINKEKWIIYVGRIDYNQKRVIRIIDIWEKVYENFPVWELKIVGDGPEKQHLENEVISRKLKRISFEGFQDPVKYYKKGSILLLTSEYEGFGLVITEGMAFGNIPIVYGSYPAVYDIITEKENGFIILPPFTTKKFTSVLESLLKNEHDMDQMAQAAILKSSDFNLENITIQWISLFKELKSS